MATPMPKENRERSRYNMGEKNPKNKLTEEQVRSVRERVAAGEIRAALAREFGVTQTTIGNIIRNKRWSWLK